MMTLTFTVADQIISHDLGERPLVAGSKGVVYADFAFDDTWDGLDIVVLFANAQTKYGQIPRKYEGDAIPIPPEVLTFGKLFVSAVGYSGDTVRKTTKKWDTYNAISVQPCGTIDGTDILKDMAHTVTTVAWKNVTGKPFAEVGDGLSVTDDAISADVLSVNGKTGAVELGAADVGALDESTLDNAIDTALAQAKASGEFKGEKGEKGDTGAEPSDERLIALITPIVTEQLEAVENGSY